MPEAFALPDIVNWAVPVFVLLIVVEMVWTRKRAPGYYEVDDTRTSLLFGFGSSVAGVLTATLALQIFMSAYALRPITIPFSWWAFIACFVLDDLAYYIFHRTAHRVRWFWASHVNHHSSQHYNLSTALRQSWTGFLALSFIFRLPLAFAGFHPMMIFFVGGLNLIYQFWIHTEVIGRMPRWFEAVMNTPSHHRVHHGINPRYLDRNFAGVLIIWDRLFGSFTPEVEEEPVRYGIVKQLGGFGLLWSAFHEWVGIAQDLWRAPFGSKLGYLFGPPGWSHDDSRDTSDKLRAKWQETQIKD